MKKIVRKSTIYLSWTASLILGAALLFGTNPIATSGGPSLPAMSRLVSELELTDLCLFTEASYTRNPSQTDLLTPFQEHPFAIEHFPAGSISPPPPSRR